MKMMKSIVQLICVVTLCYDRNIQVQGEGTDFLKNEFFESLKHHLEAFEEWVIHYSKSYENVDEKMNRMSIWVKNHGK